MQPKELHDFLFELYDFAEEATTNPQVIPSSDYKVGFIIAAYIEDFMDIRGRSLIYKAAKDAGLDEEESLKEAHARIDRLRAGLSVINDGEHPELRATIDESLRRVQRKFGTVEPIQARRKKSVWNKLLHRLWRKRDRQR